METGKWKSQFFLVKPENKFNPSNPSFGILCTAARPMLTPQGLYMYFCTYGSLLLYDEPRNPNPAGDSSAPETHANTTTEPFFAIANFLDGGCLSRFNRSNPSFGILCNAARPMLMPQGLHMYFCTYGSLLLYVICIIKLRNRSKQIQTESIAKKCSRGK
uniref:Uncharacterized protein n=1 Tax=Romanomermis culicivorax TaxID=13658 RepID=A0A915JHN8_ROMCU